MNEFSEGPEIVDKRVSTSFETEEDDGLTPDKAQELVIKVDEWVEEGLSKHTDDEINEMIDSLLEARKVNFDDDEEFDRCIDEIDAPDALDIMDQTKRGKLLEKIAYLKDYKELLAGQNEFELPKSRELELLEQSISEQSLENFRALVEISADVRGIPEKGKEFAQNVEDMLKSPIPEVKIAGARLISKMTTTNVEVGSFQIQFDKMKYGIARTSMFGTPENGKSSWSINFDPKFFDFTKLEQQKVIAHEMNHIAELDAQEFETRDEYEEYITNMDSRASLEKKAIVNDIRIFRSAQKMYFDGKLSNEDVLAQSWRWELLDLADQVSNTTGLDGDYYIGTLYGLVHGKSPMDKSRFEKVRDITKRDLENYKNGIRQVHYY